MKQILLTLVLLHIVSIIQCDDMTHNPCLDIFRAIRQCVNDKVATEDSFKCALERAKVLLPDGKFDFTPMIGYFKKAAETCDEKTAKISVPQRYENFTICFSMESNAALSDIYKNCAGDNPPPPGKLDPEMFKTDHKLACMMNCAGVGMNVINENGDFNMEAIVLENTYEFDVRKAIKECEDANMQSDKCEKGASRTYCLNKAFEKGGRDFHSKRK